MKKLILAIIFLIFSSFATAEDLTITYSKGNKFGLIRNNKEITEAIYSKLIRLGDTSWLFLKKGKYGIIDNDGNTLVEPIFSSAQRFVGHFAKLGRGGTY